QRHRGDRPRPHGAGDRQRHSRRGGRARQHPSHYAGEGAPRAAGEAPGRGVRAQWRTGMKAAERIVSLHAGYEANGDFVEGYVARPLTGERRPGVLLLSGMSGLTWTQREITRVYARAGFVALSPDFLEALPQGR